MKKSISFVLSFAVTAAIFSSMTYGQTLHWDGTDTTANADGGDGSWDVNNTTNWDSAATGGTGVVWPTAGADAVLGGAGGTLTIADNAVGSGTPTILGNVTLQPGPNTFRFLSADDGGGAVVTSTSPTWNVNDGRLDFVNLNNANDTALYMPNGGTLTVTGTGTLDTGERPGAEATWGVGAATLDFQAGTLRGNPLSVGQFGTVKMAAGSTYIHERNATQGYFNNWEISDGVTWGARYAASGTNQGRGYNLAGVVSGTGPFTVVGYGGDAKDNGAFVGLTGTNTFTGGVVVEAVDVVDPVTGNVTSTLRAALNVTSDASFGAVPASVDADNITLRNGGELKMTGFTINPNRGITLDGGGTIVNNTAPNTYGGTITGTGGLQIGRNAGADANRFVLTSSTSDYTGGTRIFKGALQLGADNAIPKGLLTIGGTQGTGANALFYTQGFDQEVTGIAIVGNQTRTIINESADDSTITVDVAAGESYTYGANINDKVNDATSTTDDGTIHFVKNGDGVQVFSRSPNNTSWHGNVTVNAGRLRILSPNFFDSNNDSVIDIVGNGGPRITANSGGVLVLNAGGTNQWEKADLDEVLDNASLLAGSRLGINTDGGDFTYDSNISGVTGIEKLGNNTLRLTGTNTYSGQTVTDVNNNNGILLINGDNSGATGDVLVQNGTLGGTGFIGGNVTVEAGATLAPGDGIGTLTISNKSLTLAADVVGTQNPPVTAVSTLNFELNGGDSTVGGGINDLINGVGVLTLDGVLNVSETSSFSVAAAGDSWRLINYTGSLINNTLELGSMPTLAAGLSFSIDVATAGQVNLKVNAGGGLACDLDSDGRCDFDDIDLLYASGDVTTTAISNWLSQASSPSNPFNTGGKTFTIGDVNLDGSVNSSDLGILLNNFGKTASTLPYGDGNLNDDAVVNSSDLGLLLNGFGFSSLSAAAVPEPGAFSLLSLAAVFSAMACRRKSRVAMSVK